MTALTVLSISSQVAYGNVGNSVAVPAMQAAGLQVIAVPTVILSNHPGLGKPAGFLTTPTDLGAMLNRLEELHVLESCVAAMTGYFADPGQVRVAAEVLRRMKSRDRTLPIVVDPILGDGTGLYVPLAVAEAIRDELVPLATCLAPNRFELEWLSGMKAEDLASARRAAQVLGVGEVLVSSLPAGPDKICTAFVSATEACELISPCLSGVPKGTGDLLTGLWIAASLKGLSPAAALDESMVRLNRVIAASRHQTVLQLQALFERSPS